MASHPPKAKRKADDILDLEVPDSERAKRAKMDANAADPLVAATTSGPSRVKNAVKKPESATKTKPSPGFKRKKLAPPRPYPTVPASVSATGPRSAHHEKKNYIVVTRKTKLGAYLRRCKDLVLKDGYKSLHLDALGAAIPHLTLLAASLPDILPHSPDEIRTEVFTGTVTVQDEIIPDDEDEDISYDKREKSTLSIVITIGDGMDEEVAAGSKWGPRGKRRGKGLPFPVPQQKKGFGKTGFTSDAAMDTA